MIILRQNNYSKAELNKLGQETDKDIREAVKGTKAEKKVDKILDKSTKEMKEATQKQYAAISAFWRCSWSWGLPGTVITTSANRSRPC